MVYTTLSIILGIEVDTYFVDVFYHRLIDRFGENFRIMHGDVLYEYPMCCSAETETLRERCILGVVVKTYYRDERGQKRGNPSNTGFECKTGECNSRVCCDECIKKTSNGKYDIDSFLAQPIEVPMNEVCMRCFEHNRQDLGGLETFPPKGSSSEEMTDQQRSLKGCKNCHATPSPSDLPVPEVTMLQNLRRSFEYSKYRHLLKTITSTPELRTLSKSPKFYWRPDDCTRCG